MELIFYDEKLNRIKQLFSCQSLLWQPRYNNLGSFMIAFDKSKNIKDLTNSAKYVRLKEDDSNTLMIITGFEEMRKAFVLRGKSCLWIMGRRVSHYPDEYVLHMAPVAAIRHLVLLTMTENPWGADGIGDISLGEAPSGGAETDIVLDGDSLLDQIVNIAQKYDLGLKINAVDKKLIFSIYQPQEEIQPLQESFGNVYDVHMISSDEDAYNVAVVTGLDSSETLTKTIVGDTSVVGFDRRELPVNVGQQAMDESAEAFEARKVFEGKKALAEANAINELTFNTDKVVTLGQTLKVILNSLGVTVQTRCVEKQTKIENNDIKTFIVVGNVVKINK